MLVRAENLFGRTDGRGERWRKKMPAYVYSITLNGPRLPSARRYVKDIGADDVFRRDWYASNRILMWTGCQRE